MSVGQQGAAAEAQQLASYPPPWPSSATATSGMSDGQLRAAAEVQQLVAHPPPWLTVRESSLSPLDPTIQRGRAKQARIASTWECSVAGPKGSPYEGDVRLLVKLPVGFPVLPPRLQVLSVIYHVDVEMRDPYEGALDDSFYEILADRLAAKRPVADDRGDAAPATESAGSEGGPPVVGPSPAAGSGDASQPADVAAAAAGAGAGADSDTTSFTLLAALELFREGLSGPLAENRAPAGSGDGSSYSDEWFGYAGQHIERSDVIEKYTSLRVSPRLFDSAAGPSRAWLAPSFAAAFEGDAPPSADALRSLAREASPGVFVFEMLTHAFCDELLAEADAYEASGLPSSRPNTMNRCARWGGSCSARPASSPSPCARVHLLRALSWPSPPSPPPAAAGTASS